MKRLRAVNAIVRDPENPSRATLTLSCGHVETLDDFPRGMPPPCFRRECPVQGCGDPS